MCITKVKQTKKNSKKSIVSAKFKEEDLFLYYGPLPSVSVLYRLSGVPDCCALGLCRGSAISNGEWATPTLHHHVQGVYRGQTSGDPLLCEGDNVCGSDDRNKESDAISENVTVTIKVQQS